MLMKFLALVCVVLTQSTRLKEACKEKDALYVSVKLPLPGKPVVEPDHQISDCRNGGCYLEKQDKDNCPVPILAKVAYFEGLDGKALNSAFFEPKTGQVAFDGINLDISETDLEKINDPLLYAEDCLIQPIHAGSHTTYTVTLDQLDAFDPTNQPIYLFIKVTQEQAKEAIDLKDYTGKFSLMLDWIQHQGIKDLQGCRRQSPN